MRPCTIPRGCLVLGSGEGWIFGWVGVWSLLFGGDGPSLLGESHLVIFSIVFLAV